MSLGRSMRFVLLPLLAFSLAGCGGGAAAPRDGTPTASSTPGGSPVTSGSSTPGGSAPSASAGSSNPAATPSATSPEGTTSTPGPTGALTPDARQKAAELVEKMTMDEQAALLVMAGLPATGVTDAQLKPLRSAGVSSVFLRGRSQLSVSETRSEVNQITSALDNNLPDDLAVWVATDQEGGFVRVLQGHGFSELPTALEQGSWSQSRLDRAIEMVGGELAQAGVNINLAPVADTVPESMASSNQPIGYWKRNYGFDPASVSMTVRNVNEALYDSGVQPVVKHFPGLGRVKGNTDTTANVVDDRTAAEDPYLKPFADSINQGLAWVMVSNARYSKLDAENLAPFSTAVITDLLRGELGYERLVISDDLCEAVAVSAVPVGQRAVNFIRAGGTMALCVTSDKALQMIQALADEAARDTDFAATVHDAAVIIMHERLLQAER